MFGKRLIYYMKSLFLICFGFSPPVAHTHTVKWPLIPPIIKSIPKSNLIPLSGTFLNHTAALFRLSGCHIHLCSQTMFIVTDP